MVSTQACWFHLQGFHLQQYKPTLWHSIAAYHCHILPACQSAKKSPAYGSPGAVSPAHLLAGSTALLLQTNQQSTVFSAVLPSQHRC